MPNDAKLGLVVGVGLVVALAVVFFRKEPAEGPPEPVAAAAAPAAAVPVSDLRPARPVPAQVTGGGPRRPLAGRQHVVQDGDTLYSLARYYYKNDAKFVDIFQANRAALRTPDPLPPGTVLTLPDLPEADTAEVARGEP